jgi:flagellar biosynthesis protein FliQ
MAKKLTIPCDRCGARLDNIPEKCPHCGEIIRDRMDPFIREGIEKRIGQRWWKIQFTVFRTYLFILPFFGSIGLVRVSFDAYNIWTALSAAVFGLVALAYYEAARRILRTKSRYHLIGHGILFLLSAVLAVLGPDTYHLDWVLLLIVSVLISGLIVLVRVRIWLDSKAKANSLGLKFLPKLLLLTIVFMLFYLFASDVWFGIQGLRVRQFRSDAAYSLGKTHDRRATSILINTLEESKYSDNRMRAIIGLEYIGDNRAIIAIIHALENDSDNGVRRGAAITLSHIGGVQAFEALIKILKNDQNERVREAATKVLCQSGVIYQISPYNFPDYPTADEIAIESSKILKWYDANKSRLAWDAETWKYYLKPESAEAEKK